MTFTKAQALYDQYASVLIGQEFPIGNKKKISHLLVTHLFICPPSFFRELFNQWICQPHKTIETFLKEKRQFFADQEVFVVSYDWDGFLLCDGLQRYLDKTGFALRVKVSGK